MANSIAQFNIQFDALQDRLQLRLLSTDDEEIRLWLTRRYVRLLLKALSDKFGPLVEPSGSGLAREAAASTGVSARFSDPYMGTDDTHLPLGAEPQLVSRIALQEQPAGEITLLLGQEEEGSMQIELGLNRQLVTSLQAMLMEAALSAEWDLPSADVAEDFTEHLSSVILH